MELGSKGLEFIGPTVSADELKDWAKQLEQLEAESLLQVIHHSLLGLEDPICRLIFYERDAKWQSLELMVEMFRR